MTSDYITARAHRIYELAEGHAPSKTGWKAYGALYYIYAVLSFAKGRETTAEDVHNAWSAWTAPREPGHRSLKPFDELSDEVQQLDDQFVEAIHQAST